MDDSTFFQNTGCTYFPCHRTKNPENFSCMFCYCPLYALGENCGGAFSYTKQGIKDCSRCTFPHERHNYAKVVEKAGELVGKVAAEYNRKEKSMNSVTGLMWIIAAYLVGNLDFGYLLVKAKKGKDIRTEGSGNPGTANVLRTYGTRMAIGVFLGDMLKGLLIVLLARACGVSGWWLMGVGLAVVCGHNWPVFLKFKGGKGVATTIGVLSALNIAVGIYPLTLGFALAFITKYISVGSMVGVGTFPLFLMLYTGMSEPELLTLSIILAVMNLYQHRTNIQRLVHGEEKEAVKTKNS